MVKRIIRKEHHDQVAFVAWFRAQFPGVLIAAIPNGAHLAGTIGQRAAQMNNLIAEGLCKGFPDLAVPEWDLFIEFKRQKGGRLSDEQKVVHERLERAGKTVFVAAGFDAAVAYVRWFGRARGAA